MDKIKYFKTNYFTSSLSCLIRKKIPNAMGICFSSVRYKENSSYTWFGSSDSLKKHESSTPYNIPVPGSYKFTNQLNFRKYSNDTCD